jgi:hypothetical protein
VRNETLWREMDVASSTIRDLENRTLKGYGHIERMRKGKLPKDVLHWLPQRSTTTIRRYMYIIEQHILRPL